MVFRLPLERIPPTLAIPHPHVSRQPYTAWMPSGPSRLLTIFWVLLFGAVSCHGSPSPASSSQPTARGSTSRSSNSRMLRVHRASFHLPFPVQREVAEAASAKVYLAGGLDASDTSTMAVVTVDLARGTARVAGHVPSGFHDAAGAVIGGRLFVFAGGTGQISDVVQSFDLATGKGRVEGTMPRPLSDLSSASV